MDLDLRVILLSLCSFVSLITVMFWKFSKMNMNWIVVALQKSGHGIGSNASLQSNLVLYSYCHSSCSWRIRFALSLKGFFLLLYCNFCSQVPTSHINNYTRFISVFDLFWENSFVANNGLTWLWAVLAPAKDTC